MMICLVNLVELDPPNNGGVSRIARIVARLLIQESRRTGAFHPVFAINPRFVPQFEHWLGETGDDISIAAYDGSLPVPTDIAALKPDLIVSPLFGGEPFIASKPFNSIPHVAGMPDTLVLDIPTLFSRQQRAARHNVYAHLKMCTRVVTISDFSRRQLSKHLKIPTSSITVVPLGGDVFQPQQEEEPAEPIIDGRYVYYPANNWPHKRHELLFQIMRRVWLRHPDMKLVLSGSRSTGFGVSIQALTAKYAASARNVLDLGYVPDNQVCSLYKHAEVMLFVSQYEGFGMPLIEAMKHGCPVICAPVSAMPEVAANAALYIQSNNPRVWASALTQELPFKRKALIERGMKNITRYSWKHTHLGWLNVLHEVGLPISEPIHH